MYCRAPGSCLNLQVVTNACISSSQGRNRPSNHVSPRTDSVVAPDTKKQFSAARRFCKCRVRVVALGLYSAFRKRICSWVEGA